VGLCLLFFFEKGNLVKLYKKPRYLLGNMGCSFFTLPVIIPNTFQPGVICALNAPGDWA
jgi:hypothetical protein